MSRYEDRWNQFGFIWMFFNCFYWLSKTIVLVKNVFHSVSAQYWNWDRSTFNIFVQFSFVIKIIYPFECSLEKPSIVTFCYVWSIQFHGFSCSLSVQPNSPHFCRHSHSYKMYPRWAFCYKNILTWWKLLFCCCCLFDSNVRVILLFVARLSQSSWIKWNMIMCWHEKFVNVVNTETVVDMRFRARSQSQSFAFVLSLLRLWWNVSPVLRGQAKCMQVAAF